MSRHGHVLFHELHAMKLEAIRAISWSVPDPMVSCRVFTETLGLQPLADGHISERQAAAWGTPAMAGARFAVVASPDRPKVLLRFIECGPGPQINPLMTVGWNAAELHVRDIEALACRLVDSPFEVIGPPRDLLGNDAVWAMQVLGPGKELLYLTEIRQRGMQRTYGRAEAAVGRPFIVVLGTHDQSRCLDHYGPLARYTTDPRPFNITVLARAHGLNPATTEFSIASLVMQQRFRIETDAYPSSAVRRDRVEGGLPSGLCLVTTTLSQPHNDPDTCQPSMPSVGPDDEWLEWFVHGSEEEAELLRHGQLQGA